MANENGALDLGNISDDDREKLKKMAEEHPSANEEPANEEPANEEPVDTRTEVVTAIALVQTADGTIGILPPGSFDNILKLQREPNSADMYAIPSLFLKTLSVQETAMASVALITRQMQAAAEQQHADEIRNKIAGTLRV